MMPHLDTRKNLHVHIQFLQQALSRSHIMQHCCWSTIEGIMRILNSDATVTKATLQAVASEYSHSTLNDTPTCSNLSGDVLYNVGGGKRDGGH